MKNSIQVFDFKDNVVRAIQDDNGNPLFNAGDICRALEIVNVSQAVGRLDDDEKGICEIDTLGGKQSVLMINESGLYSLIFTSNKPEAKAFRKWVTSEVLPTIRKTGGYSTVTTDQRLDRLEAELASLKKSTNPRLERVTEDVLNIERLINERFDWNSPRVNRMNFKDICIAVTGKHPTKAMLNCVKPALLKKRVSILKPHNRQVGLMPKMLVSH